MSGGNVAFASQPRGIWSHGFAEGAGGVNLHYAEARPDGDLEHAPLAILLHGFPEFWWSWRLQLPALAAAGYRAIAPDLRGYNLSDAPSRVEDYELDLLTEDVQRLIAHMGRERAVIVGHDWGGAVAWRFAMDYPSWVERLVVMNAPHPERMAEAFGGRPNIRQIGRSWYMFVFQIPWLPERWLAINDYERIGLIFRDTAAHPEAFPPEVLQEYRRAAARRGLTGPIHFYRAAVRAGAQESRSRLGSRLNGLGETFEHIFGGPGAEPVSYPQIEAPTLLLWGERDTALGRELTNDMESLFTGPFELTYLPDSGHWVQQEAAEDVNRLMLEFLERYRDDQGRTSG
ncbi:MAG: alpha/beta hydrolase [Chloroflexi bacterium]|nr:alpha/beta hydrolase [Chloroflexota bacterium]MYF21463.1 alpha/beta hydrolase [Chloroflexota bacterium]